MRDGSCFSHRISSEVFRAAVGNTGTTLSDPDGPDLAPLGFAADHHEEIRPAHNHSRKQASLYPEIAEALSEGLLTSLPRARVPPGSDNEVLPLFPEFADLRHADVPLDGTGSDVSDLSRSDSGDEMGLSLIHI